KKASMQWQAGSSDIAGMVGGQKQHREGNLFGCGEAAKRNTLEKPPAGLVRILGVVDVCLNQTRVRRTRDHAIYADAVSCIIEGETAHISQLPAFGGRVRPSNSDKSQTRALMR